MFIKEKLENLVLKSYEIFKDKTYDDSLSGFFSLEKVKEYYMNSLNFLGYCETNEINQDVISNFKYLEEKGIIYPIEIIKVQDGNDYGVYLNSQIILMLLIDKEYRKSNCKKDIQLIINENENKLKGYNDISINIKIVELLMRFLFSDKVKLSKKFKTKNSKEFSDQWIMDKLNILYSDKLDKINKLLNTDLGFINGYKYEFVDYSILNRVIQNKKISGNYLKHLYKAPLIEFEYINQIIHLINQYHAILDRSNLFSLNDVLLKLKTPSGYRNCQNCYKLFKCEYYEKIFSCSKECSKALKNRNKRLQRKSLKLDENNDSGT